MVNVTKQDAELTLVELLICAGITGITKNMVKDFELQGGETNAQIQEYVNDYVSELHTEKCEAKQAWRYEH